MKYSAHLKVNGRPFQIGEIVYHRKVYEHREPLVVKGILENELLLEGDYSGGTHNTVGCEWLPIVGVSRIYNHAFKEKCRKHAIDVETLAVPVDWNKNGAVKTLGDLLHHVMVLTAEIELNPEFQ